MWAACSQEGAQPPGHRFTGVIENFVDPNQMASSKAISYESINSVIKKDIPAGQTFKGCLLKKGLNMDSL